MTPIYQRVLEILAEQLGQDIGFFSPGMTLREAGADSLDDVELAMAFEEEYLIDIPDTDFEHIATVQNIVDYITAKTQP